MERSPCFDAAVARAVVLSRNGPMKKRVRYGFMSYCM
jgi:hypothetical protein